MDNRQIAELISERIGQRPVPFEAVRTLALEIYHDLGGREDDENFADIFEILLSILPLTNLIDDTSIYLDKTWSSYKIDESFNQVITGVEELMNFDCSTIEPTTTNFVPGTEYTVHEALQRTANLFGGYQDEIDDINALIPGQATESNQLADKSFVNSTVATNAANFRGNWTNWSAVPTEASLYPEDYVGNRTPTNNDYMMVQDTSDYDGFEGSWRFIYVGDWNTSGKSGWNPQYKVGSTFTAVQQDAIDSGITATKVATYDGYGTSITALQTDKLDKVYTALKIYGADALGGQISYEAGTGISFENGKISNTNTEAAWGNITGTLSNQTDLSTALDSKQDVLTAGNNITINGTTISANDTTYSASDNIDITNNAIKAVGYRYDTTNGAFAEGDRDIVKDGSTYLKSTATGIMSHAEGIDTSASGDYSHAEGYKTTASGVASHAGGYVKSGSIIAKVDGSFAHGYTLAGSIDASGRGAVAMGYADRDTIIAKGNGAHAEGVNTNALNTGAHAEGYSTTAEGRYSHAEGINAEALADGAHAEGRFTTAKGDYSHAEGNSTYASEFASHAEGNQAKATGTNSHAEGQGNTGALGTVSNKVSDTQYTLSKITTTILEQPFTLQVGDIVNCSSNYAKVTAINDNTITIDKNIEAKIDDTINLVKGVSYGKSSHSEGYLTAATENYAHTEGEITFASGTASHAEGQNTIASGIGTHVEGVSSWALADGAHAEGNWTTAEGEYSHAEGYYTYASGAASHAEGKGTTAAFSSVRTVSTQGSNYLYELSTLTTTISNKSYTLQVGNTVNFGPNYAKITAIDNQTITTDKDLRAKAGYTINLVIGGSFGDSAHSEGYLTSATGDYSHAEGYNAIASGAASHAGGYVVLGGSINADGDGSFAHGHTTNGSISATGKGAVAIGWAGGIGASKGIIKASGGGAHAEGYASRGIIDASGNGAHAEGCNTAALAKGAHAEGCNTAASGNYSHAEGFHTEAKNQNEHAEGKYNQSHEGQTIHSIGIGTSKTDRKNAFEVIQNGDAYLIGVGNYDGIHIKGETGAPSGLQTLQETVNGKQDALQVGNGIDITDNTISALGYEYNSDINSITNGFECVASGTASHAEGSTCVAYGENSHAEGYQCHTLDAAFASHAEGIETEAYNIGEHAQGKYNVSHQANISETQHEGNTIVSVGIGEGSDRKNAFEIMQNGDIYVYGLGNYNGTITKIDDPAIMTLQDILKTIADALGLNIGALF